MRRITNHQRHSDTAKGMILVAVLVVVAMVGLAGYRFAEQMFIENKAVHLRGTQLKLRCAADSGVELIAAFVQYPREMQFQLGGRFNNPDIFRDVPLRVGRRPAGEIRFNIVSPEMRDNRAPGLRYGIENESARLNLGVLPQWDRAQPGAARQALMRLPAMTESIADAILDWIDTDGTPRPYGAEADFYSRLDPPYTPRNGPVRTIEELLLVRDVHRKTLFGADTNRNFQIDPDEAHANSGLPGKYTHRHPAQGWQSLLTLYSAERNDQANGQPRIHLNQNDLAQLSRELTEVIDKSWAEYIVAYRQFGPYRGGATPSQGASLALDLAAPGPYRIDSVLDLVGTRVAVGSPNGQQSTILASPWTNDGPAMRENLPKLMDRVSVTSARRIVGRIDVNRAAPTVLAGVPGMKEETVERIVAARSMHADSIDPQWQHATWLLTEGVVDLAEMKTLLPYLTGGGDVHRAQIIATEGGSSPSARLEVVIDATLSPPQLVVRKDLSVLGGPSHATTTGR